MYHYHKYSEGINDRNNVHDKKRWLHLYIYIYIYINVCGCGWICKTFQDDDMFRLIVSDNGVGYDENIESSSLGLVLVNTLAKQQLRGDIKIDSQDGVKVEINWRKDV